MNAPGPDFRESNPYPGLRPFREEEEYLFFGRESQVDALVDRLARTRFLAVVGTSGSGKSSLVNCGLRPALRRGLMAAAGTAWRMAQFRPGNAPVRAFAQALAQEGVLFRDYQATGLPLVDIVETTLQMSKLGLVDICEQARLPAAANLLVVVDQFEELFRYRQLAAMQRGGAAGGDDATALVNLLLETRSHADCRIYVVLTMRSDFLGDCAQFPGLAEAINAGQYLVPRMTRDERRAAITGPALVGGAQISPVLLTRLVNDVGDNPDQLSILQHALNRTWARWQRDSEAGEPLTLAHYEAIGTMAHALDQHAERAYAELSTDGERELCEKIFRALTDKATDARGVRRPTTLGTLCAVVDAPQAEVVRVLEVFRKPSRSFVMPPAGEPLTDSTVIDLSHESLMRVWRRLETWAEHEARSAIIYRRLAETAMLYQDGHAALWRAPDLDLGSRWEQSQKPNRAWAERYHPRFAQAMAFLEASRAQARIEADERARAGNIRTTIFGGALLALFSALLVWLVYVQYTSERELDQQRQALSDQLRSEQAQAASSMREYRAMSALFGQSKRQRFDSAELSQAMETLSALDAAKLQRDIGAKLGQAAPLPPDERALLELYDALSADALPQAQRSYMLLIRDATKALAPVQAAWENWAHVKRAEARERKLIAALHQLAASNAASRLRDEATRAWRDYSAPPELDANLFVHRVHFKLASKLHREERLERPETLLAEFYARLEREGMKAASSKLRELTTRFAGTAEAAAAAGGWRAASHLRDRMYLSYLSRGKLGSEDADAGASSTRKQALVDRVGVLAKHSTDRNAVETELAASYVDERGELKPGAFADPLHFGIACKLKNSAGPAAPCLPSGAPAALVPDERNLLAVYDALEASGRSAAEEVLRGFETRVPVHYLFAASALGDPDVPARPSLWGRILGWLDELKVVIAILLIWPAWEGLRWVQRRLGLRVRTRLRANPVRRLLAGVADLLIALALGAAAGGLVGSAVWLAVAAVQGSFLGAAETAGFLLGLMAVNLGAGGYLLFRDAIRYRFRRSFGKILFNLRPVVIDARAPVTLKVSAKRNALLALPFLSIGVLYVVPFLSLLGGLLLVLFVLLIPAELILTAIREGRTIHDRMGGTRVIDIRSGDAKAFDRY